MNSNLKQLERNSSLPATKTKREVEALKEMKRCHSASPQTSKTYRQRHEEALAFLENANASLRELKITCPKEAFTFDGSLSEGIRELGRISKELEEAEKDLAAALETKKNPELDDFVMSLSIDSCSSSRSNSGSRFSSISSPICYELDAKAEFSLYAAVHASLQMGMVVGTLNTALDVEEKNMMSRAGALSRTSQEKFPKINPKVLSKMSCSSTGDSMDSSDDEDEADVDEIFLAFTKC